MTGIEPATSGTQDRRSSKLSYTLMVPIPGLEPGRPLRAAGSEPAVSTISPDRQEYGGGGGDRTPDLTIIGRLLFLLSYSTNAAVTVLRRGSITEPSGLLSGATLGTAIASPVAASYGSFLSKASAASSRRSASRSGLPS